MKVFISSLLFAIFVASHVLAAPHEDRDDYPRREGAYIDAELMHHHHRHNNRNAPLIDIEMLNRDGKDRRWRHHNHWHGERDGMMMDGQGWHRENYQEKHHHDHVKGPRRNWHHGGDEGTWHRRDHDGRKEHWGRERDAAVIDAKIETKRGRSGRGGVLGDLFDGVLG